MIPLVVLSVALIFLVVLTILSISEMSLGRISKVSLRRLVEKDKSRRVERLKDLVENRVSIYVGIQVSTISIAIVVTAYLHSELQSYKQALPAAFGVMFLVVVIFRQLIPRIVNLEKPDRILPALIPVLNALKPVLGVVSYPLSWTLRLVRQVKSPEEEEKTSEHIEEELEAFIHVGQEEGILEKEEGELIQSVVEFGDKVARDIMVPRTEMVTIEITAPFSKLKQVMGETKYSRIPVYRDQVENIQGLVYLKDLIDVWDGPLEAQSLEKLLRPIHFVPETKRVSELLAELQRKASHMAVVIDEYGGVAGLVTIEDILEEIAGEIHDEGEVGEMEQISKDAQGRYAIAGNTPIEEVEELLGIHLENQDSSTVAGFINSALGRVPRKGEKYEHQGFSFEVKEADRRKIHKLLISPAKELSKPATKDRGP